MQLHLGAETERLLVKADVWLIHHGVQIYLYGSLSQPRVIPVYRVQSKSLGLRALALKRNTVI